MADTVTTEEKRTPKPESGTSSNSPAKNGGMNEDSNILALLSYFWILSIVFYIIKKDDSYVVFHARQGVVLFVLSIILMIIGLIPVLGRFIAFFGDLALIVLSIIGMIKAYQGERYELPVIGGLAEKISF